MEAINISPTITNLLHKHIYPTINLCFIGLNH